MPYGNIKIKVLSSEDTIVSTFHFIGLSFVTEECLFNLAVECEHDDDIYGHSYDDHDYGMSPGTGQLLKQIGSGVALSVSLTVQCTLCLKKNIPDIFSYNSRKH